MDNGWKRIGVKNPLPLLEAFTAKGTCLVIGIIMNIIFVRQYEE